MYIEGVSGGFYQYGDNSILCNKIKFTIAPVLLPPFPHPITGVSRLDDQIFINRNPGVPSVVKFHPFNTCIAVADKENIWSETLNTHKHTLLSTWWFGLKLEFDVVVVSGTGRRERGLTTSPTETLVTLASRPWSTWTDMTALCCSLLQVWDALAFFCVYTHTWKT